MTDESEAARARRTPAPPPRQTVRPPEARSRSHIPEPVIPGIRMPAPPRLFRPSEHLAIVERQMERRPAPLMPMVTVVQGPRPPLPPPQPPVYRHVAPPPLRMPAPPSVRMPPPRREIQVRIALINKPQLE
ncbi:unnamed protein product [Arctia plantaginis]|uniref:Uncharacterized protein n=1 Tax=Arctia plantaginis TaxID=874455 RepID=A0A8S1APD9_ARCPL|nr:unnamed protein product [Arctia plantaginis]